MKTSDLILAGALGLIGWLLYRFLDSRADAISGPAVEPFDPFPTLRVPRIRLPLIEANPAPGGTVTTDTQIGLPSTRIPIDPTYGGPYLYPGGSATFDESTGTYRARM